MYLGNVLKFICVYGRFGFKLRLGHVSQLVGYSLVVIVIISSLISGGSVAISAPRLLTRCPESFAKRILSALRRTKSKFERIFFLFPRFFFYFYPLCLRFQSTPRLGVPRRCLSISRRHRYAHVFPGAPYPYTAVRRSVNI